MALYAVQGAIRFYAVNGGKAGNIPDAPAVAAMRDRILQTSNPYAELFEDNFEFDPAWDTKKTAVNKILRDTTGSMPKTWEKDLMLSALKGFGVSEVTIKGERFFRGMRLTPAGMKMAALGGGSSASPCFQRGSVVSIAAE